MVGFKAEWLHCGACWAVELEIPSRRLRGDGVPGSGGVRAMLGGASASVRPHAIGRAPAGLHGAPSVSLLPAWVDGTPLRPPLPGQLPPVHYEVTTAFSLPPSLPPGGQNKANKMFKAQSSCAFRLGTQGGSRSGAASGIGTRLLTSTTTASSPADTARPDPSVG